MAELKKAEKFKTLEALGEVKMVMLPSHLM
jgi:hypothetical protein